MFGVLGAFPAYDMQLLQYLAPGCSLVLHGETERDQILDRMVAALARGGFVRDEAGILARLRDRERQLSTAIGRGIALPHCYTGDVSSAVVSVAVVPSGVDFHSLDGEPTYVVFLLIENVAYRDLHVQILARITMLCRNTTMVRQLRVAECEERIRAVIHELDTQSVLS